MLLSTALATVAFDIATVLAIDMYQVCHTSLLLVIIDIAIAIVFVVTKAMVADVAIVIATVVLQLVLR